MISIIATLKAAPGKEEELKAVLSEMVSNVKDKEKGAVTTYSLHQSDTDPTNFVFYETYSSQEAFDAHGKTPHMAAMGQKLGGLLGGRPDIQRLTRVASID